MPGSLKINFFFIIFFLAYGINSDPRSPVDQDKYIVQPVKEFPAIVSLDFNHKTKRFITTSQNNSLGIWNFKDQNFLYIPEVSSTISSAVFSPDGKYVLMRSAGSSAVLTSEEGKTLCTLNGHDAWVKTVGFSKDGKFLLTGSDDNTARIWNFSCEKLITITSHSDSVNKIAVTPDGKYFATASDDSTIMLWDFEGKAIKVFRGHQSGVTSIAFSPDGKFLVSGSHDDSVKIWDMDGSLLHSLKAHTSSILSLSISDDSKYIVSGGEDNILYIWDFQGRNLGVLIGHEKPVIGVNFISNKIVSAGQDGVHILWNLKGSRLADILITSKGKIVFTPEGRYETDTGNAGNSILIKRKESEESFFSDQLYEHLYTPELLYSLIYENRSFKEVDFPGIFSKASFPGVTITSVKPNSKNTSFGNLEVKFCNSGDSPLNLLIYQNASLIGSHRVNIKKNKSNSVDDCEYRTYPVRFVNGKNYFKVTALNKEGLEGYSEIYEFTGVQNDSDKPELYLVIAAIGNYNSSAMNLKQSVSDAVLLKDIIKNRGKSVYSKINIFEIYNENVTSKGFNSIFQVISRSVKPQDVVIVWYSGRMHFEKRDMYIMNHKNYSSKEYNFEGAINLSEFIPMYSGVYSLKKIMIFDAVQTDTSGSEPLLALGLFGKRAGISLVMGPQKDKDISSGISNRGIISSILLDFFSANEKGSFMGILKVIKNRFPEIYKMKFKKEHSPFVVNNLDGLYFFTGDMK